MAMGLILANLYKHLFTVTYYAKLTLTPVHCDKLRSCRFLHSLIPLKVGSPNFVHPLRFTCIKYGRHFIKCFVATLSVTLKSKYDKDF